MLRAAARALRRTHDYLSTNEVIRMVIIEQCLITRNKNRTRSDDVHNVLMYCTVGKHTDTHITQYAHNENQFNMFATRRIYLFEKSAINRKWSYSLTAFYKNENIEGNFSLTNNIQWNSSWLYLSPRYEDKISWRLITYILWLSSGCHHPSIHPSIHPTTHLSPSHWDCLSSHICIASQFGAQAFFYIA